MLPPEWVNDRTAPGTAVGVDELNEVLFNWGSMALTAGLLKVAIDAMEATPARMSNLVPQNMVFADCDTKLATRRANSRSTKLAAGTVHIVVFLGVFAACSATFKRLALTATVPEPASASLGLVALVLGAVIRRRRV